MRLLKRGRHRKKKMPESFPLVIMGFAVLIGISGIGFFLSPGPSEEPPYSAQTPYSASPSEKGTESPRVTPTPKTSSTASKSTGSATKPVTRKPSATPKPSTTPKPPTKPPTTKPDPPKTETPPKVYTFYVKDSAQDICSKATVFGESFLGTGTEYFSYVNDEVVANAHAAPPKVGVEVPGYWMACPTPAPDLPIVSDILNVLS